MRMIIGLDHPTAGDVTIDGKHYAELTDPLRSIGALLEAKAVHGGRTAYDHLLCLAQSNRIPDARVGEVLEMVGLTAVAKKRSKGFSLGMGQRLGIAAALLGDPEVVMFDEPVNGLDPEGILWIRNLMKRLAENGRTVFVSSHLMSEMALTADHLVVIGRGKLMADMSMADFIAENSRSFVRVRTPQPEKLRDALAAAGLTPEDGPEGALELTGGEAAAIGELAHEHGVVLHELSEQRASLEEAFMRLTAESVEYAAGVPVAVPGAAGAGAPQAGAPQAGAGPQASGWGAGWQQKSKSSPTKES
jgi:ABC-2 type transport system ATP-binding protein